MFIYRQIADWAQNPATKRDFCFVEALGNKTNTCQEMLALTLALAVADLRDRLGPFNTMEWQLGKLRKVRYEHPLGKSPLKDWFEYEKSQPGGRRTAAMSMSWGIDEQEPYQVTFGSVFRSTFDMAEPTSAWFSLDTELDQSVLYGKRELTQDLAFLWEKERYFRLPTYEMADAIRFKLKETEESTFLHPTVV